MNNTGFKWRLLLTLLAALLVSACDRYSPQNSTAKQSEGQLQGQALEGPAYVPSSPAAEPSKLPYGAAAPTAPGTDGVLTSQVGGVPSTVSASNPDNMLNAMPPAAGGIVPSIPLTATEVTFVTQSLDEGVFELRVAQLASDRASDSAVKSYAALVATEQTAMNAGLQQLAHQLGLPAPGSLSEPKQRIVDGLARSSDLDFDREFLAAAGVQEQQRLIELFERTGRETRNVLVRNFALETLPTLRAHLVAAQRVANR